PVSVVGPASAGPPHWALATRGVLFARAGFVLHLSLLGVIGVLRHGGLHVHLLFGGALRIFALSLGLRFHSVSFSQVYPQLRKSIVLLRTKIFFGGIWEIPPLIGQEGNDATKTSSDPLGGSCGRNFAGGKPIVC